MHTKEVPEPGAAGTRNQKLICSELSSPRQHAQCCTVHCTIAAGYFFCFCSRETSLALICAGTGRDVKKRELRREKAASSTQPTRASALILLALAPPSSQARGTHAGQPLPMQLSRHADNLTAAVHPYCTDVV